MFVLRVETVRNDDHHHRDWEAIMNGWHRAQEARFTSWLLVVEQRYICKRWCTGSTPIRKYSAKEYTMTIFFGRLHPPPSIIHPCGYKYPTMMDNEKMKNTFHRAILS